MPKYTYKILKGFDYVLFIVCEEWLDVTDCIQYLSQIQSSPHHI